MRLGQCPSALGPFGCPWKMDPCFKKGLGSPLTPLHQQGRGIEIDSLCRKCKKRIAAILLALFAETVDSCCNCRHYDAVDNGGMHVIVALA